MMLLYHIGEGIAIVSCLVTVIPLLLAKIKKLKAKNSKLPLLFKHILAFSIPILCISGFLTLFFQVVPDVTGLTCDSAIQTLREHNFSAITLNYESGQGTPAYDEIIKAQDPINKLCRKGTTITLYYGEKAGSIDDKSIGQAYEDSSHKRQNEGITYFAPGKDYAVGDKLYLGTYEQNNKDDGKEWIEWEVISVESDRLLVISTYGLKYMKFQAANKNHTWNDSSLRAWLNGTEDSILRAWINETKETPLYESAFTEEERQYILLTEVKNDKNPTYFTPSGTTTYDRIFCLSIEEAIRYFTTDEARIAAPTEYAVKHIVSGTPHRDGDHWWLRTMGHKDTEAACVRGKEASEPPGTINYYGSHIIGDGIMVRPAMWITNTP